MSGRRLGEAYGGATLLLSKGLFVLFDPVAPVNGATGLLGIVLSDVCTCVCIFSILHRCMFIGEKTNLMLIYLKPYSSIAFFNTFENS